MIRLAVLAALLAPLLAGCGRDSTSGWNVVLVTFDTTRADYLQPYGHPRTRTPTLQNLAAQGALFEQAFSAAPITAPSHATILTGRYPLAHGVRDNGLFVLGEGEATLAEILRENGYATAAAVGAFPVIARFGFNQGFDLFDDELTGHLEDHHGDRVIPKTRMFFDERRAGQVNEAVLPWLGTQSRAGKPFFLWLHYFDPHQPFEPPRPFDQQYADDLYAGEIAYADQALGRLLSHLDTLGQLDRTLIVMTADHGEGLGEHGELTHAVLAYNSTLRVPLIIRVPGGMAAGMRLTERVGTVDIVPTVLDLLGIDIPAQVQGRTLTPLLRGEPGAWRQYYAENLSPHLSHGWGKLHVLFDGAHKYIHGPNPELYDLHTDPDELRNLFAERQDESSRMHGELEIFLDEHVGEASVSTPLDDETMRRLQSLGYLQGGATAAMTVSEALDEGGIPPTRHVSLINDMSAAKHLLFARRYADAAIYTRKLIAAAADSPNYVEMHLAALLGSGQGEEAWSFLHQPRTIEYLPSEQIMTALALSRFAQNQQAEARDALQKYAHAHCAAQAWWTVAGFEGALGNPVAARAALDRALECDPDHLRARIDRAITLDQAGDPQAAEAEFQRALQLAPFEARVTYNYATFLHAYDRVEEAQQLFERTLVLAPDYHRAMLALVILTSQRGEREAAKEWLARLTTEAPHSPEAIAAKAAMAASVEQVD